MNDDLPLFDPILKIANRKMALMLGVTVASRFIMAGPLDPTELCTPYSAFWRVVRCENRFRELRTYVAVGEKLAQTQCN